LQKDNTTQTYHNYLVGLSHYGNLYLDLDIK